MTEAADSGAPSDVVSGAAAPTVTPHRLLHWSSFLAEGTQSFDTALTGDELLGQIVDTCRHWLPVQAVWLARLDGEEVIAVGADDGSGSTTTAAARAFPATAAEREVIEHGSCGLVSATHPLTAVSSGVLTVSALEPGFDSATSLLYIGHSRQPDAVDLQIQRAVTYDAGLALRRIEVDDLIATSKHAALTASQALAKLASDSVELNESADLEIDLDRTLPFHLVGQSSESVNFADILTPRQIEVLELMLKGLSNQDIAETLVLSVATVKHHVRAILQKFGAANRVEAIALIGRLSRVRD
ncbi:hypothetical protein GP2_024_00830 [Gordonia paraffinivorans NBRC 108238]|uniref:HTH luxR-type domain-containing protein n=1 Tax=Gordonia paraffinivorans NBRC 108238 TaxID=1223543 RepID=A0ABQ0IM69_9ACTN|nr:helix-turn-helix transcriptional regulator [Gordonia paraffinivorans]GAC84656.1 hypothetical protein GP2_024_00830 [Gordonia paraffinivorans NBRC 108238]